MVNEYKIRITDVESLENEPDMLRVFPVRFVPSAKVYDVIGLALFIHQSAILTGEIDQSETLLD